MALFASTYCLPSAAPSNLDVQPSSISATVTRSEPALILIHGGASSSRMYKDMLPYLLNRGYPLLVPDLPGHGRSVSLGPFTFSRSTPLLHDAITAFKARYQPAKTVIVGISLGGQAVLDLLAHHPNIADAAIVSGVAIHPPDDKAQGEVPHLPSSQKWTQIIIGDVQAMGGIEKAQALQAESFAFRLGDGGEGIRDGENGLEWPPVLVVVGDKDTAMARRDFDELSSLMRAKNDMSKGTVIQDAWHNHSIDVPERFAELVDEWVKDVFCAE
ncbi:MAG: hypothetical protein M1812_002566 [Candelaria pacifica]|nr:MAG: hypothetical protein M1812_002566 [Candelaria pacifica]